ncbi:DUF2238 domain-containing protein [Candidatus Woesearchaeota archaeon]|nr:DUF2238 domain-containing protein [Candidatus Woesearchaeota archaeon]
MLYYHSMIDEKVKLKLMLYFTLLYLLVFTAISLFNKNYEFLYYTLVMSLLLFLVVLYHKKLHLTTAIIFGLTVVGAMHIFGGNIHIFGTRLYEFWLIPGVFKYDNLVHIIGTFVATFISYSLLFPHLDKKLKHSKFLLALVLILIASGIGAFNEVLELFAVVFLGATKQVGDYLNNALDLLFNFIGAIIASIYIVYYHKRKR